MSEVSGQNQPHISAAASGSTGSATGAQAYINSLAAAFSGVSLGSSASGSNMSLSDQHLMHGGPHGACLDSVCEDTPSAATPSGQDSASMLLQMEGSAPLPSAAGSFRMASAAAAPPAQPAAAAAPPGLFMTATPQGGASLSPSPAMPPTPGHVLLPTGAATGPILLGVGAAPVSGSPAAVSSFLQQLGSAAAAPTVLSLPALGTAAGQVPAGAPGSTLVPPTAAAAGHAAAPPPLAANMLATTPAAVAVPPTPTPGGGAGGAGGGAPMQQQLHGTMPAASPPLSPTSLGVGDTGDTAMQATASTAQSPAAAAVPPAAAAAAGHTPVTLLAPAGASSVPTAAMAMSAPLQAAPAAAAVTAHCPVSSTTAMAAATSAAATLASAAQQSALLSAAGLQTVTALVPTGATPEQLAGGMPAMQAVPMLVQQHSAPAAATAVTAAAPTVVPASAGIAASIVQGGITLPVSAAAPAAVTVAGPAVIPAGTALVVQQPATIGTPVLATAASPAVAVAGPASGSSMSTAMLQGLTSQLRDASSSFGSSTLASLAGMAPGAAASMASLPVAGSAASYGAPSVGGMSLASLQSSATALTEGGKHKKVKVLLSSGGTYEQVSTGNSGSTATNSGNNQGNWQYVGGETRLVPVARTTSFSNFLQQLSRAATSVWDENCRLMYDLPGTSGDGEGGTLVDLIDDEDLEMMWEELDVMAANKPGFKLHVYVQLGDKRYGSQSGSAQGLAASLESSENLHSSHRALGLYSQESQSPRRAATSSPGAKPQPLAPTYSSSSGRPPIYATAAAAAQEALKAATARAAAATAAAAVADASDGTPTTGTAGTPVTGSEEGTAASGLNAPSSSTSDHYLISMADLEARLELIRPEELQPVRLLGIGGYGEVYLCKWHSSDVAVKCLNPNLLTPDGGMGTIGQDLVADLVKEANVLSGLRHPNIVWVYGLVLPPMGGCSSCGKGAGGGGGGCGGGDDSIDMTSEDCSGELDVVTVATAAANRWRASGHGGNQIRPPALVCEYMASGSLRAAISRKADFLKSDSIRIKMALDTARGMAYLHSKRIVHFDLKTGNLLVGLRDRNPTCKVADFGLSKQRQQTFVTGIHSLRGTLPWIAPEVIKFPKAVTELVDVYSFGIVMWELWLLREPFEGLNYHALLHLISTTPGGVRPTLPGSPDYEGESPPEPAPGWRELLTSCWHEDPAERPTFPMIVERLQEMQAQKRMERRSSGRGSVREVSGASGTS